MKEKNPALSLDEARDKVKLIAQEDVISTSLREIRYEGRGLFTLDKNRFALSDVTQREMCSLLGIKKRALTQASDSLMKEIVVELLPDKEMNVVLTRDEDVKVCKHFIRSDTSYLSSLQVFDAVVHGLKGDLKAWFYATPGMEIADFITTHEKQAKKGDIIRAGITFESRIRDFQQDLSMGPFCWTLQCTNGMIGQRDRISDVKVKKMEDFVNIITASVKRMYDLSKEHLVEHLIKAEDQKLEDPTQLVHRATKEFSIGTRMKNKLLDRVPGLGKDPTYYDLINMVTRSANEIANLRLRRKIQAFGGYMTINSEHRCPHCKTKL